MSDRPEVARHAIGYGVSGIFGGVAGGLLSERYGFGSGAVFWAASLMALLAALSAWRSHALESVRPAPTRLP